MNAAGEQLLRLESAGSSDVAQGAISAKRAVGRALLAYCLLLIAFLGLEQGGDIGRLAAEFVDGRLHRGDLVGEAALLGESDERTGVLRLAVGMGEEVGE